MPVPDKKRKRYVYNIASQLLHHRNGHRDLGWMNWLELAVHPSAGMDGLLRVMRRMMVLLFVERPDRDEVDVKELDELDRNVTARRDG